MPDFATPPPNPQHAVLSFPAPHVLLVTLNRPRDLNCINAQGHADLHDVWEWMDEEPSLRNGTLKPTTPAKKPPQPPSGFGGVARRKGKKPLICAINGLCFGGGAEMIINADIVIAASRAVIGLPEVKRGVVAMAGALPRLVRTVGKQRAMEMVLTGRTLSAVEAERWGLVNEVVEVPDSGRGKDERENEEVSRIIVARALGFAADIAGNSPDAVLVSREGVKLGWEGIGADEATGMLSETWVKRLYEGENIKEGLQAFVEKRAPLIILHIGYYKS
ncbi:hypothetical protein N7481_011429 [Penicillium waksmanii]|uniref:uncharacterized protein n=1 Tax=Penicillium waksmanii TaxID=69791 RepID=UPI0025479B01|nr:uncharacterized protein N7481_011429 [Penicillium waksmanii]KAJ5974219.1 hypothetical protein N7481_011429 [Penicillium waksmanii]